MNLFHLQLPQLFDDIPSPGMAKAYGGLTMLFAVFASILPNVELWVRIVVGIGALVTAYFSCRYYSLAAKEKELSIMEKEFNIQKQKSNT
ncbi:MAG: hypothetical protein EOO11_15830, partial [Chitinophagaceae bacterium]